MVGLLLIACCLLSALLGVALAVSLQAFRAYASIRDSFIQFVTPAGEGTPSPMAETIDGMARQVAARLSQELLASFNGQASGMARGLKAVEGELAQATLANTGNPLAMIAGTLFQKQIKKNPLLGVALAQLNLGNEFGKPPGPARSNGGSPKFSL